MCVPDVRHQRLASFFIFKHIIQNCQLLRLHSSSESEWTNESINQCMNEWSTLSIVKIMTDKTRYTCGGGDPTRLALSTTNLKCNGLEQTQPLSDRLVPNHVTHGTEVWALMSPLNFYCVPPPSTAVMLHSRHCNTVLVQSQHTAHSVKCGLNLNTLRNSKTVLKTTRRNFLSSLNHLLLLTYQGPMMEKKSMCKKMCKHWGNYWNINISAAVAGTSYTAVVTTVTIIATNLCTAVATDNVWQYTAVVTTVTIIATDLHTVVATDNVWQYTAAYLHTTVVTTVTIIATDLCTAVATDNVWQYTAVVTTVTIIATDLCTAVVTMCGNIQLWLPLSES